MRFIENRMVPLKGLALRFAAVAKAAVMDTEGAYTTVAHFLCGENPWGFHNDLRFSMPPGNVRQGTRIMAAAEAAIDRELAVIELSDEDYERVIQAVFEPERHVGEMRMPTVLARALIPIVDAIENAETEPMDVSKTEPAPPQAALS